MRAAIRITLGIAAVLLTVVALAADLDPRGWHRGTLAVGTARVLGPVPERIVLDLPSSFAKTVKKNALLVYFSPTCPHCRAVAHELRELSEGLPKDTELVWIASGSASAEALEEFRATYAIQDRMVRDEDRVFVSALGVRSTPSALLVGREKKELVVRDLWYPYLPGFDTLVRMRLADDPWSAFAPGAYQGNNACGACHQQELEAWTLTHHSIAWNTLVEHGEQLNGECNGCHVTGKGEGGWETAESPLVDVGCEACHGPGGPHDGARTAPEDTCLACHDEKHSIAFTYEKGLPHLDHYATVALTDEAYVERRKALVKGEVARPALAFLDGEVLGTEACQGCHPEQHAKWKDGPHAHAMARLEGEDAKRTECQRCHATQSGSAFRVEESVGCEACHGPGEAHVKAGGGTTNIEKLGDDCPVCVIEAVCTSCHTARWDPDWDLEADLPKVGH